MDHSSAIPNEFINTRGLRYINEYPIRPESKSYSMKCTQQLKCHTNMATHHVGKCEDALHFHEVQSSKTWKFIPQRCNITSQHIIFTRPSL